jgi:hypothetical protein
LKYTVSWTRRTSSRLSDLFSNTDLAEKAPAQLGCNVFGMPSAERCWKLPSQKVPKLTIWDSYISCLKSKSSEQPRTVKCPGYMRLLRRSRITVTSPPPPAYLAKIGGPVRGRAWTRPTVANHFQAILHLKRLSNLEDFDRGRRNLKYFAALVCVDSNPKIPDCLCFVIDRLSWPTALRSYLPSSSDSRTKNIVDVVSHKCKIFCIRGHLLHSRSCAYADSCVPWFVTAPDSWCPSS